MKSKKEILDRKQELQYAKDQLINKRPDSEEQREYYLSKIRVINSRMGELNFCLNT